MSRFFWVGSFPFGVATPFGATFFAVILVPVAFLAVAFFAVVFLEVVFVVISAPELALDRFYSFPRPAQARRRDPSLHMPIWTYIWPSWHEPPRPQMRSTQLPSRSGGGSSPFLKGASVRSMSLHAHCGSRSRA